MNDSRWYSSIRIAVCCLLVTLAGGTAQAVEVRPEYPRPDFERSEWRNLNGQWSYALDYARSGAEKGYPASLGFDSEITVPFCPESRLSGVEHKDFISDIWYQKTVEIPAEWLDKDILLNFGAVYNDAEVYVNGRLSARHYGGSSPFSVDITSECQDGNPVSIVVHAVSDVRSGRQGAGKQSRKMHSNGCNYTRTTGIWQPVWLEPVAKGGLKSVSLDTDIHSGKVVARPLFVSGQPDGKFSVVIKDGGKVVAKGECRSRDGEFAVLSLKNMKLWSPESPFLYDVEYKVYGPDGKVCDEVKSYLGCREVEIKGNQIYLNGEPCWQRLVLDQGYYPDGIWTAPTDEDMKNDILRSKAAGFNGARLHQKVFDPRYHYWADRLGFLTWGEAPSWGMDANDEIAARNFINDWRGVVERDRNHPSIIIWTPLNEEWWPDTENYPRFVTEVYDLTKSLDPSRPINDASGGCHVKTDIWTVHTYEQNPDNLSRQVFDPNKEGEYKDKFMQLSHASGMTICNEGFNNREAVQYPFPVYDGRMPFIVDEFGGMKWNPRETGASNWGYGDAPNSEEEFMTRLESQVDALLGLEDNIAGYCYTQLSDVEQECNGLYYYDRTPKFDVSKLYRIFSKQPKHIKK